MEEESDSFSVTSVGEGDGETWTFVNTKQFPINGGKPLEDSDNCSDHGSDGSSIVIIDDLNPQVNNLGAVEESRPSIADVYGEDDDARWQRRRGGMSGRGERMTYGYELVSQTHKPSANLLHYLITPQQCRVVLHPCFAAWLTVS